MGESVVVGRQVGGGHFSELVLLDRWKTCQLLVVGGLSVVGGFGIRRHGWNNLKEPKCFFVRCSKAVSNIDEKNHCMKSVQIRRFFWYIFSHIRTEYGEIRSISPYSARMREKTDQENLHIWTLFYVNLIVGLDL